MPASGHRSSADAPQTILKEWAYQRQYYTNAKRLAQPLRFVEEYNSRRPHRALGYKRLTDLGDNGSIYGESAPEFFVLNRQRKVVYMGGMDDNSLVSEVTKHYLEPAVEAALAGKAAAVAEAPAIGCRVRYERERRTRKEK